MAVTLFPNGVSNANIGSVGQTFPADDPSRVASFFDEFYSINAATGTTAALWRALGATPVAPAVVAGSYGRIRFSPAGASDTTYIQLAGNPAAAAGSLPLSFFFGNRDVWFQTLFQISNASLSVINAGLFPSVAAAGDPGAAADGVFFTKASGTTTLSLKAIKTAASNSTIAAVTLADNTDVKVGFHWNPRANRLFCYVNDQVSGSIPADNIPTVGLLPLIGHGNNTAARTSDWDYVHAAQARQSETTA